VSDFIEWVPKHHGHQPLHWTPDMLTSVDGKNFVRANGWAWIAGSVYYVPPEAVGVVREAVDPEPVVTDADRIEALQARVKVLEEALTPSAATKAAYMSEFSWTEPDFDECGGRTLRQIVVPWTVIKTIMATIRALAALEKKP
jgi:hypothetical protein